MQLTAEQQIFVMLLIELAIKNLPLNLEHHREAWELLDAIQIQRKQEKS